MEKITEKRYRQALCPYLLVGNRRVLVHLDVYGVPQSLQWPFPGAPDRLSWRDQFDEWPYWDEMEDDAVRDRMPFFEYADGKRDYLHEAETVESGYLEDTNILEGRYTLPGGAEVSLVTFVPPGHDAWVRRYTVKGRGQLVLNGEFFEKAVRGHAFSHLGEVDFRGGFTGYPRGVYVIMSRPGITKAGPGSVKMEVPPGGRGEWTICLSLAENLEKAVGSGREVLDAGADKLLEKTAGADRAWISRAREPVAAHPLIRKHYRRWLLGTLALTAEDGMMPAGPRPFWSFSWPRDSALQCVGYAAAGFYDEARQVVGWHIANTPPSGVHEARYFWDRSPMLLDNRPRQQDGPGLLGWAAGEVCRRSWDREWAESIAPNLYLMADQLDKERDPETLLPTPGGDHREGAVSESIGIAVPAFAGLQGASFIAGKLGDEERAARYARRALEIREAMEKHLLHPDGHFMTSVKPEMSKPDISACWGVLPMRAWPGTDERIQKTVRRLVAEQWESKFGGTLCAKDTEYESYWTLRAAFLLLGAFGIGDREMEAEILEGIEKNAPPQGLLPEQFGARTGSIWGCAPLPFTQAALLIYAYEEKPASSSG